MRRPEILTKNARDFSVPIILDYPILVNENTVVAIRARSTVKWGVRLYRGRIVTELCDVRFASRFAEKQRIKLLKTAVLK